LIVPELAAEPGPLAQLLSAARQHYWISIGSLTSLAAIVTIAWLAFGRKADVTPATDLSATEVARNSDREQDTASGYDADAAKNPAPGGTADSSDRRDADGPPTTDSGDQSGAPAESADASAKDKDDPQPQPAADGQSETTAGTSSSFLTRKADPRDPIARALATEPEPLSSSNPGVAPTGLPDPPSAGETTSADAGAPAAIRSSAGGADEGSTADSGSARRAVITAHLQDKLPQTEFRGVPLVQFLAFLTDFSTVPIAIDSEALEKAGKDPKIKISIKLSGETVEAALRAALAKPGLAFRIEAKRIVITAAAAKP
jgi:hypothetical protein